MCTQSKSSRIQLFWTTRRFGFVNTTQHNTTQDTTGQPDETRFADKRSVMILCWLLLCFRISLKTAGWEEMRWNETICRYEKLLWYCGGCCCVVAVVGVGVGMLCCCVNVMMYVWLFFHFIFPCWFFSWCSMMLMLLLIHLSCVVCRLSSVVCIYTYIVCRCSLFWYFLIQYISSSSEWIIMQHEMCRWQYMWRNTCNHHIHTYNKHEHIHTNKHR